MKHAKLTACAATVLIFVSLGGSCTKNDEEQPAQEERGPTVHNPARAARMALDFAEAALFHKNPAEAFDMISAAIRNSVSYEDFEKGLAQSHPTGYPTQLTVTHFYRIPEPDFFLDMFMHGSSGTEEFYYRFTVGGSEEVGYKPAGFSRMPTPFPEGIVPEALDEQITISLSD